jgi:ribonuclease T1
MKGIARLLALAAVLVVVVALGFVFANTQQNPGSPAVSASPTAAVTGTRNTSGLESVAASRLPAEARQTLALIARGGPYPYERDGAVFGNFERLLPRKPGGYYKEFTVRTPGESDRGARRIIAGQAGEKYYTPDHYETFLFIDEGNKGTHEDLLR